jgi:hypothetical protein
MCGATLQRARALRMAPTHRSHELALLGGARGLQVVARARHPARRGVVRVRACARAAAAQRTRRV